MPGLVAFLRHLARKGERVYFFQPGAHKAPGCQSPHGTVECTASNVCVQHRCVSIFLDRKANAANPPPVGFALGSIEGRVAIHYVNPSNPKDNFTFKCHRSNGTTGSAQDIYAVVTFYSVSFFSHSADLGRCLSTFCAS